MRRTLVFSAIFLSIAAFADDKDKKFTAAPAASYPNHQTQAKITIAAVPYVGEEELKAAFGKDNPNRYGILPVLVVIQNDSDKALKLDLETSYVDADGRHVDAVPPQDVPRIVAHKRPHDAPIKVGSPIPIPHGSKKGPLSGWEIPGRAFSMRLLPAGDSASGFFYFDVTLEPGAHLYLSGLSEAGTGNALVYYEIPLDTVAK